VVDNYKSFSHNIEHLITTHGYRKIALVSGPDGHPDARERMSAYLDCMQKHGLPVTREMVAFGDYSEYVDDLVSKLIDENPGLEAIAFSNDEMAKAGYRECRRRGLVIGRDIAITGFDNFNAGRTMEPPLTTIAQDVYRMGQLALERAAMLMNGQQMPALELNTEFLIRQSCGCPRTGFCYPSGMSAGKAAEKTDEKAEAFIDAIIREIVEGYASHFTRDTRETQIAALSDCFAYLRDISLDSPREPVDYNELAARLDVFFMKYTQPTLLLSQCLEDFLRQLMGSCQFSQSVGKFGAAVSYMDQYIHTREVRHLVTRLETYRAQTWIAPELTRGLFNEMDEGKVYRTIVERLVYSGLRNVYVCLLEEPQCCRVKEGPPCSTLQKLYLAAYAGTREAVAYPKAERPVIDANHPFWQMPNYSPQNATMVFSLFSGENQYGILLCDEDRTKSELMHMIGLQLGMLIDFMDLRDKERAISEELESIRDKNEILNFLSEYDSLCGLLNRRGFIEQAIRLNRENIGKTAYCAFMDLDYLKQINDTFGHTEGDVALQGVSAILHNVAGKDDLLGRIGGDEFIGLFLSEDPLFEKDFDRRFQMECNRYNSNSGRSYLLDISVGIVRFVCQHGLEVSSVIADADRYLYEAKHNRTNHELKLK
jgi:diguanylate cyclase (GGDEF)-like protein